MTCRRVHQTIIITDMLRFLRPSSLLIAPLISAALLAAQSGPGPEQDQGQASSDATIRVNVDLVNLFFTVRAKKGGALIPNLEQGDFQVFEEGKQQTIKRFSRESDL